MGSLVLDGALTPQTHTSHEAAIHPHYGIIIYTKNHRPQSTDWAAPAITAKLEMKTDFQQRRAQLLKASPDTGDVMRLTAEVDRKIATGNRCLGLRFTSFLASVQQFAALGNVVVGGSQNIIACGVWSVVRMSILALTKHSSYVENMSIVFMEVGRSSPRYQELALVYSRSQSLQAHMNEYFVVVVRLCQHIIHFGQRSANAQSDLSKWAREIEDEMRILLAKWIEDEAEQNSRFRLTSAKWSKSSARQQELAGKLRVLNSCSTHDQETRWKQLRKMGHTTSFLQGSDYVDWRSSLNSCTLLFLGILGSGKSVMLANIVDDLNLFVGKDRKSTSVVYFFVRHDMPASSETRTIIGSIVRQLLRSKHAPLHTPEDGPDSLDIEDMLKLSGSSLRPNHRVFLVLDGLDACGVTDREQVIKFFSQLQGFYTTGKLILSDPSLILSIQDALLAGSRGMFLWVALQLNSICALHTDDEMRRALESLPEDLSVIYFQVLKRHQRPAAKYQQHVLQLITASQRPLTTEELREALSVIPGDTTRDPARLVNDVYAVLTTCGCLVITDEEELTLRFIHPTLKQFLVEGYVDKGRDRVTMRDRHSEMANIIVTYLNYGIVGTDVSTFCVPRVAVGAAPAHIIRSTMPTQGSAQAFALKLLKLRKRPDFDIGKTIADQYGGNGPMQAMEHPFLKYAHSYCLQHVANGFRNAPHIRKLLPRLLAQENAPRTGKIWEVASKSSKS
ncbi:hypothetical protein EK21DRAFT_98924 [Setomelanomma holmii]|uniref:NACHT domain-containing protein n=1 Tax=Setomelanomma holmii TaxID=210430 RepID=A0A9P4HFB9_9PLEO|nr:hypothetical protein EK21DRAFT_98924 [Setomelanomma holmii]